MEPGDTAWDNNSLQPYRKAHLKFSLVALSMHGMYKVVRRSTIKHLEYKDNSVKLHCGHYCGYKFYVRNSNAVQGKPFVLN